MGLHGQGEFPVREDLDGTDASVKLAQTHAYDTPGTSFATARVFSNREGDVNAEFRLLQNLASARIVVTERRSKVAPSGRVS